jgi:hypothetical protein
MSSPSPPTTTTEPPHKPSWAEKLLPVELPDASNHLIQIVLRTYAVALSLSLGPSLLPFVVALFKRGTKAKGHARSLKDILNGELGPNGFAFAITVAVGGGAALQHLWQLVEASGEDADTYSSFEPFSPPVAGRQPGAGMLERNPKYQKLKKWSMARPCKAFVCNLISSTIAIILLQGKVSRNRSGSVLIKRLNMPLTIPVDSNATKPGSSPTLDLTLLLLVRAVDVTIQSMVFKGSEAYWSRAHAIDILGVNGKILVSQPGTAEARNKKDEETKLRQKMTTRIDAFIFWACSARSVVDMHGTNAGVMLMVLLFLGT